MSTTLALAVLGLAAAALATSAVAQQVDLPRRPGVALGLAANNPLNLSHSADAIGFAPDRDGNHVAVYPSLRTGIDASLRQLMSYQAQGYVTPRQMVTRWVCGVLCTAEQSAALPSYVRDVAVAVHAGPDEPVNFGDPGTAAAFILAAQPHETGPAHLSIQQVKGLPAIPAAPPTKQPTPVPVITLADQTRSAVTRQREVAYR